MLIQNAAPVRQFGLACTFAVASLVGLAAVALPPEIPDIGREQSDSVTPAAAALLRIWLIGVGQGDAILIELPPAVSAALGNPTDDPLNLLIDGGATPIDLAKRTPLFLRRLYPDDVTSIEHMVLTHHDRDHVAGLTRVLEHQKIRVDHVYGSGLAAYRRGVRGIPTNTFSGGFVGDGSRALGRFDQNRELEAQYLVGSLEELKARAESDEFTSDFGAFAKQVAGKSNPAAVQTYEQACFGCAALDRLALPSAAGRPAFRITTVWPLPKPRRYGDWGKTTNGNSVAFRLDYGAFSMLFTGDLNENSEPELMAHVAGLGRSDLLNVDILKAPHHGSAHNAPQFLLPETLGQVVSVASMGSYGFLKSNYKHPHEVTIGALGGSPRFFSTFIHERNFERANMNASELEDMVEDTHVLIETDGQFFRIVEIRRTGTPTILPLALVPSTRGTRWIRAE